MQPALSLPDPPPGAVLWQSKYIIVTTTEDADANSSVWFVSTY